MQQLLRDHVKVNINANDISAAHRIGSKPKTQGPDKRGIIVKLCRRNIKSEIFSACKNHKPPFYVNENLTPTRNKILYLLRNAKRMYPNRISSCKSFEGKVYVFIGRAGERSRRLIVNSMERLDTILKEEIDTSLEALVKSING